MGLLESFGAKRPRRLGGRHEILQRALLALLIAIGGLDSVPVQARVATDHEGRVSCPRSDDEASAHPRLTGWDLPAQPLPAEVHRARTFALRTSPPRPSAPASAIAASARATRFVTRPRMRRPRDTDPDDH